MFQFRRIKRDDEEEEESNKKLKAKHRNGIPNTNASSLFRELGVT